MRKSKLNAVPIISNILTHVVRKIEPCHNMNQTEVGQFSSDMLRKAAEYAHFNKQRENNVLSQQLAAMQMGGSSSVQNTPQQQGTLSSSSHDII